MQPTDPTHLPAQPPVPPSAPAGGTDGVDLVVSKRLLWVGGAVYPLQNVTRVYTFTVRPRRLEAVLHCLRRVVSAVSVVVVLRMFNQAQAATGTGSAGSDTFVTIVGVAAVIYFIAEMLPVLTAQPQFVLAVETSGPSRAVVTSRFPHQLVDLVGRLAYAIDHPEMELHMRVERLTMSPRNYHFGDNVNMYGGTGNVGVSNR